MQSLARAVSRPQAGGAPLPAVFQQLASQRADVRRSEVTLVGAEPGVGKTAWALWHCQKWAKEGLIGLYFSADSSELVIAARLVSMRTGYPWTQSEAWIQQKAGHAFDVLEDLDGIRFCFDPDVTLTTLELEVMAFIELWGREPDFIVIDNLTDVEGQSEDEFGGLRRIMKTLKYLARQTSAGLLVLHHTSEAFPSDPCPPRKAFHGKVTQKAAVALTLGPGLNVAVVKNRYGPSDKSGRSSFQIHFDGATMQLSEHGGYRDQP